MYVFHAPRVLINVFRSRSSYTILRTDVAMDFAYIAFSEWADPGLLVASFIFTLLPFIGFCVSQWHVVSKTLRRIVDKKFQAFKAYWDMIHEKRSEQVKPVWKEVRR